MKKLIAVLAIVVATAEFHSAGAAVVLTNLNPKSLLNTDFDLGAFARADINALPISGTQQGGSYRVNAGVNGVGSVASGSAANGSFSLTITNNTAFVLDSINLTGSVFQLKGNTSSLAEKLTASVTGGGSISDPSVLDINSVLNAPGANNPPVTAAYNVTLSSLNLAVGDSFTITWTDANDGGTDAFFGLSNITVQASAVPEPSTMAVLIVGGVFGLMHFRRRLRA
jgi:hypothetical protein